MSGFCPHEYLVELLKRPTPALIALSLRNLTEMEKYAVRIHMATKRSTVPLLYQWVQNGWL